MSGSSEIRVVDAKQVVANPSPDTANSHPSGSSEAAKNNGSCPAIRRRLPGERHSLTHHFSIGGQEGYVTVGLYEDGAPGEMFIRMAKEGSIDRFRAHGLLRHGRVTRFAIRCPVEGSL